MQTSELTPIEAGWLRGGDWAATQTALAMLYRRGALQAGRVGTVERVASPLAGADPLERALYAVLYGAVGPRELMNKPRSRSALSELRRKVAAAGLVRPRWRRVATPAMSVTLPSVLLARLVALGTVPAWAGVLVVVTLSCVGGAFVFRRTIIGARTLRQLRVRHADLSRAGENQSALTPQDVGMAVALFGDAALLAILPKAAHDAGLLDGGRWSASEPQPAETPIQYG
jgi:uncharacterized protein (TIGR04222 family)